MINDIEMTSYQYLREDGRYLHVSPQELAQVILITTSTNYQYYLFATKFYIDFLS